MRAAKPAGGGEVMKISRDLIIPLTDGKVALLTLPYPLTETDYQIVIEFFIAVKNGLVIQQEPGK